MMMLYEIPTLVIASAFFLLLLASSELGFRQGKYARKKIRPEATQETQSMQGATLGMLGLLLGFTFAMSGAFYAERSSLAEREASMFENAMMNTSFISNKESRIESQHLWIEFAQFRLESAKTTPGNQLRNLYAQDHALRMKIWQRAVDNIRSDERDGASLYAQSVSRAFTAADELTGAKLRRVPEVVIILLLICGCVTAATLGHGCGLGGARFTVTQFSQYLIIALILAIIIDLDRPARGINVIDHSSLHLFVETAEAEVTPVK